MLSSLLAKAVEERKVLAFDYDDKPRLVEPHAIGTNAKGQLVLRAFQVTGDSATNATAWKLFTVDKMVNCIVAALTSQAPRPGYKAGDRAMANIIQELPEVTEAEGKFQAGFGRLVTDWFDSRTEALDAFRTMKLAA